MKIPVMKRIKQNMIHRQVRKGIKKLTNNSCNLITDYIKIIRAIGIPKNKEQYDMLSQSIFNIDKLIEETIGNSRNYIKVYEEHNNIKSMSIKDSDTNND